MATVDNIFLGDVRILYVKIAGVFLPVACLSSNSFSEGTDSIDTTTRDNAGWATSQPTNQSYSIEFEGVQINTIFQGGDFTKASYDRLKALKRGRSIFDWEIRTSNGVFVDYGQGFISSLSEDAPAGELLTFAGTITGYGEPKFTSDTLGAVTFDSTIVTFDNTLITWDNDTP